MTGDPDLMILRQADIDAAVAAGVIEADVATRLIAFAQSEHSVASHADEENLRLITSFNDIFVTIGLVLFLGALGYVLKDTGLAVSSAVIAATSWGFAEVFTRIKRLALPSIFLLIVYSVAVFGALTGIIAGDWTSSFEKFLFNGSFWVAIAGFITAGFVGLHWLRFRVPITIAAGCAALGVTVIALAGSIVPQLIIHHSGIVFLPMGLVIFALAMRFDMSDRTRATRRTDIAFWLHLLSAPLIVHPIVIAITSQNSSLTYGDAELIIGVFFVVGLVALIIDRRALLASSLIYLGYAAYTLMSGTTWASTSYAETSLVVGGIVLMLSVAWRPLRRIVVATMPNAIRMRVPAKE